ncbi:xanthine dehydrogenase family protein molybdopterin-binding subunit [Sphingobium sufflavum]|uniref:aldehyde oxidoreductase molybdenum-binding subunit PaoC n=1 Tax=Sphingobium sufflavum TaxID=1129547 RepID=UPI001F2F6E66|nr:aldehyde oxidoreductase molybdenum-binding subunit PaoC [Sphingobium sufflavum]MCE7797181.1 xanthine dehydrogenase family protein molybdopterin-binding subunit [Sphingobium sufflavum]
MKFDTPATGNAIDRLTIIGHPVDRIDGPLKTSGRAPYAYEHHAAVPNPAYGVILGAAIATGRIRSIDTAAAEAAPGVLAVITYENAGKIAQPKGPPLALLAGPRVSSYDQAVALVVAESFEEARAATRLIRIDYAREQGRYDLAAEKDAAVMPPSIFGGESDTAVGDFDAAFAAAPVRFDQQYSTPDHSHVMMEPHASLALWEGEALTLWTSSQMIAGARRAMAMLLGLDPQNVRILSPYIGGGFGAKLGVRADALLAAVGARAVGRPVKVALTRPQSINNTTHRPATLQRIRIGATADGRITAIGHEGWSGNLPGGSAEAAVQQTRYLYAGADRMTTTRLAVLDLPEGGAMRAPGEAPGMMALEIAMDEMAERLGLDPIAFRILNDTQVDPENPERPYSLRQLTRCFEEGAAAFGWDRRRAPGAVRDGRWLVGMGVAAAFRNNVPMKSAARVVLNRDGRVTVMTDMTDIGTGSYTIIAQTVAEAMGVPLDSVEVLLGDSRFPVSAGSGGQWGAHNATSGVFAACMKLREDVALKLGFNSAETVFEDGMVRAGNRHVPLAQAAAEGDLTVDDAIEYGDLDKRYQQSTFGAHFVEAAVDAATGEVRVRRMLAVCAAGRILNPKTARSQVIGAMVMGVGAALMEELVVDRRFGFFVNHDLAGYEVPVHADIPHQEVIFLDEVDPISSPMKAKGVGELGICGVGAAVANAIYNACGVRVRDYPITLDKLIGGLPAV